jgi:hypothetical protein
MNENSFNTERCWWMWFLAGFIAGPIATLIHELGHYIPALILGLRGAVLHVSWVSYTGSAEIRSLLQAGHRAEAASLVPLWKVALVDAGGPVISLVLLAAAVLCRRRSLLASAAAGLAAGWRLSAPAGVAAVLLLRTLGSNHAPLAANVDEFNAARALDINPLIVILPAVLAMAYALGILAVAIPKQDRWRLSVALCAGLTASLTIYLNLLGPALF